MIRDMACRERGKGAVVLFLKICVKENLFEKKKVVPLQLLKKNGM